MTVLPAVPAMAPREPGIALPSRWPGNLGALETGGLESWGSWKPAAGGLGIRGAWKRGGLETRGPGNLGEGF